MRYTRRKDRPHGEEWPDRPHQLWETSVQFGDCEADDPAWK
jgi:hypothetical protein